MIMIRWTTREWELIARRLQSRGVEPQHHGWLTAVVEAMRFCLPAERWRAPHSLNESKKVLAPIMQRLVMADNSKEHDKAEEVSKSMQLEKFGMDELMTELIKRMTKALMDELRTEIDAQVRLLTAPQFVAAPRMKHDPCPPTTAARPARPVVLVVGPKNGQQRELENNFVDFLELHFVASHENPALIAGRGTYANHIVLWTDFISHAHQAQAKQLHGRLHYVTGGMSALLIELRKIATTS